ncbi:hypothetical protein FHR22_001317 [Sphingopyxis panaciterrae]|uniref:hypothetical protein n=1 Tax=Sphingopyxis panaciterrae TaxID=363841 RepID=UPI0014220DAB|nr:hypothetical protein [Sphingopyxis panaciterrae]NIJ36668.1 hypothetical protein [Sphingopyxis panaciterrae]
MMILSLFAALATAPLNNEPVVSRQERDAIVEAAGFRPSLGGAFWIWRDPSDPESECDAAAVDIVELRDRNDDGRADALIAADGPCYDNQGPGHLLVAATGSGWRLIAADLGREPRFYPRTGIEWPDIEHGDADIRGCRAFDRWDGVAYAAGGTSREGHVCELRPPFAQKK